MSHFQTPRCTQGGPWVHKKSQITSTCTPGMKDRGEYFEIIDEPRPGSSVVSFGWCGVDACGGKSVAVTRIAGWVNFLEGKRGVPVHVADREGHGPAERR